MDEHTTSHIEIRKNRDGQDRAYIAGTRVRVQDVYAYSEIHGMTPDAIVRELPHLTLGQVHAALSYYFDHRQAIQDEICQDEEIVERMRAQTGAGPLEQKLTAPADQNAVSS